MPVEVDDAFKALSSLSDSVTHFFRKRAELEAAHLENLEKLLARQEEVDKRHDALFHDTTILQAWTGIKAIVYAEIVERRQLVYALQHSIVDPLTSFKDQKERQRRRIKEETSNTAVEHTDYKAHTLRLKRAYQKKSEEVKQLSEHHAEGGQTPSSSLHASGTISPTPTDRNGATGSSLATSAGSSHNHTQHLNEAGSSSSGNLLHAVTSPPNPPGDHRILISGATSSSLRDAHSPPPINNPAMQAIKTSRLQLNNLINKLGSAGRGGPHSSSDNLKPSNIHNIRLSKARREAEESDANYRSALHHLETLRLQRERVSKASLGSLNEFCFELSATCRSIFAQYCDYWTNKARKTEKLCEMAKNSAYAIAPEQDVQIFHAAANVGIFYEDPMPYENYHVGVSYSLIFGVSLNEYSASNDGVLVPLTIQRAILEIDSRGLDVEGIYRIPGKMALIQQIVQSIERDEITFEFDSEKHDVHTVAGVLKLYLRQLPEPLLPFDAKERDAIFAAGDEEASRVLSKRLRRMSPAHQATAKMLVAHFARVLGHTANNKMSAQALTLCLNPVLFPEETSISAVSQGHKDRCLEFLIAHRQELFQGLPVQEDTRSPYRMSGRSGESGEFDDYDDDPPLRRSQESMKLSGGGRNASHSASGSSQLHDPSIIFNPGQRTTSMLGPGHAISGSPMERMSSKGSSSAASSSDAISHAFEGVSMNNYHQIQQPQYYQQQAPQQVVQSSVLGPHPPPGAASTAPLPMTHSFTNQGSAPSSPSHASAFVEQQQQQQSAPKRSLSQRARSGSASLANAVKSLGRAKSPPVPQVHSSHGSPTSSMYQPQQQQQSLSQGTSPLAGSSNTSSTHSPLHQVDTVLANSLLHHQHQSDGASFVSTPDTLRPGHTAAFLHQARRTPSPSPLPNVPAPALVTHLAPQPSFSTDAQPESSPSSSSVLAGNRSSSSDLIANSAPDPRALPAGAAPLLGRPLSSTSSAATSALSTPALPGAVEHEPVLSSGMSPPRQIPDFSTGTANTTSILAASDAYQRMEEKAEAHREKDDM